jgi:catechol 2,3-dioxygenase-like lactoylglutathione lyase family enzyme
MFKRLAYTTLLVSDQDKALEFYTGMLGFKTRVDYPGPEGRFLTIALEDGHEVLLWRGTAGAPGVASPGTLFVESDDLRKDFDELRARGVHFVESAPEDYPFGVRITALDPDGNRVALRQRRH